MFLVLGGGVSPESYVSQDTACFVYATLAAHNRPALLGFVQDSGEAALSSMSDAKPMTAIHTANEPPGYLNRFAESVRKLLKECGITFIFDMFHGGPGYDGTFQKIFEDLRVPYSSGSSTDLQTAASKSLTKDRLRHFNVRTPKGVLINAQGTDALHFWLDSDPTAGAKMITKPDRGGSSLGISMGADVDCISEALRYDDRVVVEEFIEGIEFTCAAYRTLAGVNVLKPICRRRTSGTFYSYDQKYSPEHGRCRSSELMRLTDANNISQVVKSVAKAFSGLSYFRCDIIVQDHSNEVVVLEVNAIPHVNIGSSFLDSLESSKMSFIQFLESIVELRC